MKSILLHSLAGTALALGLAGCGGGGGDNDYEVRGYVSDQGTVSDAGVRYAGLKLTNGGDTISVAPKPDPIATPKLIEFAFPTKLGYGDIYHVQVSGQPAHQSCSVVAPGLDGILGRDSAGRLTEIRVVVTCKLNAYNVVVATPKPLAGLTLTNGSRGGRHTLTGTETSVSFVVPYGESYGVTILEQPTTGGPCTVENGVGVMGDAHVTNVKVVCP